MKLLFLSGLRTERVFPALYTFATASNRAGNVEGGCLCLALARAAVTGEMCGQGGSRKRERESGR